MTDYPTRDELDEQFTWDLTQIYETPADWEAALEDLERRIEVLGTQNVSANSPGRLTELLEEIEAVLVTKGRLKLYAMLTRNEDTTDEARRDRLQRARRLAADVVEAVQTVRRQIQRESDMVEQARNHPALSGWDAYLDDLLVQAPHTRDATVESVVSAFKPLVENQTDAILAITTDDFEAPAVEGPDGDPFVVDHNTYREAMASPDRTFRKRAYQTYNEALGEQEHALAAVLGDKIRGHAALARTRNYDSVRAMALNGESYPDTGMHLSFPESAHHALLENVRDHLTAYHALLESRQEVLGVETLRPWDTNAPLIDRDPPDVTYPELREHLITAVEPLGEEYRNRLATFLNQRRIDVYPTEKKRTDIPAYCPSNPETGAFILANFREDIRTAFILAHELGHAMHIEEMRDAQPLRYVNSPRPISEVPSIVHELLLADYLQENHPTLAPFVRERRAEFLAGNVYGAGQRAAFLHDVYRTVEDGGDLTPDRLSDTYAGYAAEFGRPIASEDRGCSWRRQAYARKPYHNYQYVLGATTAVSLFQRIKAGDLTSEEYRDFLRNTGRRDSLSSFRSLGVEVTTPDSYERLAAELEEIRTARLASVE